MRNESDLTWPVDTQLFFVGGDNLAEVQSVPVGAIKPNEEVDVAVDMKAPKSSGRYTTFWRLASDAGSNRFGHRVWCDIIVQQPAPVAAPAPVSVQPPAAAYVHQQPQVVAQPPAQVVVQPAAPAPVTQPAAPAEPELEQLVAMGFVDRERVRALLKANNNDILRTVQALLNVRD